MNQSSKNPDLGQCCDIAGAAGVAAAYSMANGAKEPAFLGEDYVCTDLPTRITLPRTQELPKDVAGGDSA